MKYWLHCARKKLEKAMPTFFGRRKSSPIWVELKALEQIVLPRHRIIEFRGSPSESAFWTSFEPI